MPARLRVEQLCHTVPDGRHPFHRLDLAGIQALEAALRDNCGPLVVARHGPVFAEAVGVNRRPRPPQGQLG
jgi:hypothetical protein